jgi:cellulose synthase/poly-beta-1,6-N-acetylglucosamine synthase-like glycosyltransferase
MISVVIPLFDKASTIRRALDSVCAQTAGAREILVVDDGSTDGGGALARAYPDERVRLIEQENQGVGAARNAGIRAASGELVAFLDADDAWEPDFLETILALRRDHPAAAVFGTGYLVHQAGLTRASILRGMPPGFDRGLLAPYFAVAARSDPPLCSSSVAVTREALASVGGFPAGVPVGEDLLTWARLAVRFDVAYARAAKAHFWAPEQVESRPGRVPQEPDVVAAELRRLLREAGSAPRAAGLERYLGVWYEMRGLVHIELRQRRRAVAAMSRALRHAPGVKTAALLLLALAPASLARRALAWARAALRLLRRT